MLLLNIPMILNYHLSNSQKKQETLNGINSAIQMFAAWVCNDNLVSINRDTGLVYEEKPGEYRRLNTAAQFEQYQGTLSLCFSLPLLHGGKVEQIIRNKIDKAEKSLGSQVARYKGNFKSQFKVTTVDNKLYICIAPLIEKPQITEQFFSTYGNRRAFLGRIADIASTAGIGGGWALASRPDATENRRITGIGMMMAGGLHAVHRCTEGYKQLLRQQRISSQHDTSPDTWEHFAQTIEGQVIGKER